MENESVTVNVIADAKIFRKFALFDSFCHKRIWLLPVIFASIMSIFAILCFTMKGRAEQAVMIGSVLLIIGLGLPIAYIRLFFKTIKTQIKTIGLEKPRVVYSLRISREHDGIQVISGDQPARYEWCSLFRAYRVRGCIYLYVKRNKAFLLPDGQAESGEDVWPLFTEMMPTEKLYDYRSKI
jgi:hypothetical protein